MVITLAACILFLGSFCPGNKPGNPKIHILLTPKNGFCYKDGQNNIVVSYLRAVGEYQTVGNGIPQYFWQDGSLRFTYQETLPTTQDNANMQIICGFAHDHKLKATVTFQVVKNTENSLSFCLTSASNGVFKNNTISKVGKPTDEIYTISIEQQTINQEASFFFSAAMNPHNSYPYFISSILIEEI